MYTQYLWLTYYIVYTTLLSGPIHWWHFIWSDFCERMMSCICSFRIHQKLVTFCASYRIILSSYCLLVLCFIVVGGVIDELTFLDNRVILTWEPPVFPQGTILYYEVAANRSSNNFYRTFRTESNEFNTNNNLPPGMYCIQVCSVCMCVCVCACVRACVCVSPCLQAY